MKYAKALFIILQSLYGLSNYAQVSGFNTISGLVQNLETKSELMAHGTIIHQNIVDALVDQREFDIDQPGCISQKQFRKGELIIIAPGCYRLRQDVTGTIKIKSSGVMLDLNGHVLSAKGPGIQAFGVNDIVIQNGSIAGCKDCASGIDLRTVSNARCQNLAIRCCKNGISVENTQHLDIQNVAGSCNKIGFVIEQSQNISLSDSSSNNNKIGVSIKESSSVVVAECMFNDNEKEGILFDKGTCIECVNCRADGNCVGFTVRGASHSSDVAGGLILRSCSACYNSGAGFLSDETDVAVTGCVASNNGNGFLARKSKGLFSGCQAINNHSCNSEQSGFGFCDDGLGCNQYFSNIACDNDINFCSDIVCAPITSCINARGRDNIDCCSTDIDQIDLIESITQRTESIIENIENVQDIVFSVLQKIESNVIIIDAVSHEINDISIATLSNVEHIEQDVDTTLSKVCAIESIVQNISSVQTQIETDLQAIEEGAQSTASKIETLNKETKIVQSLVDLIHASVFANSCCSTIERLDRQLGPLINSLSSIESIMVTVESKSDVAVTEVKALSSVFDTISIDVDTITSIVENTEAEIEVIERDSKQTQSVVETISSTAQEMNEDLKSIESVTQIIETQLIKLAHNITFTESAIEHLSSVTDVVEEKIDALQSNVQTIASIVIDIDADTDAILSKVGSIEITAQAIEQDLGEINSIVQKIETTVVGIESDTDQILSFVIRIESIVEPLQSALDCAHCDPNKATRSIVERIESIVEDIENDVDQTLSVVEKIESVVEKLSSSCSPIALSSSTVNGNYTISVSGTYCLVTDVTASISINVSDVVLDLNGHTLNIFSGIGIAVNGSISNVVIKNGLLLGSNSNPPGSGAGIKIQSGAARNIIIENITSMFWFNGIESTGGTQGLTVNNVICNQNFHSGLRVVNCIDVEIRNSSFNENGLTNPATSEAGVFLSGGSCIELNNCTANNDGILGGFVVSAGQNYAVSDCYACGNSDGNGRGYFVTNNPVNSSDIFLRNCVAQNNTNGYIFSPTPSATFSNSTVVRGCIAHGNDILAGSTGFHNEEAGATAVNRFYQNVAANNAINWMTDGAPFNAPVAGHSSARTYYNIDGSLP